jgi:prepilin-type N-terminal cleavage/methylation domain-containing protein
MHGSMRILIRALKRRGVARGGALAMRLRADGGFTLFEVLIAAVVLAVGLVALLGLLDSSVKATASTRAREGATNLARELLEDARTMPYAQISPNSIVGELQAMHGLANESGGPNWQIVRRGVTYTVLVKACSIDDPKDGWGKHENGAKENPFCKDAGEKEGTEDGQPEDLKRITAEVSWTAKGRKPVVKQVETLTAAGGAPGLNASELKLIEPNLLAKTAPVITSTSVTKLVFSVQSPSGTSAMEWSLDGVKQTKTEPTFVKNTEWQFSWSIPLPEVSDGSYQVSVQAIDATGVYGPPISIPVTLIRTVPAAPKITNAGFNEVYVGGVKKQVVELQWQGNTERNVIGYRVYNPSKELACPTNEATLSLQLSCVDLLSAPKAPKITDSNLTYSVVALYRAASGEALSEAISQSPAGTYPLSKEPTKPNEVPVLSAKTNPGEGSVVLTWKEPVGGPTVLFYRVYRAGKNYTERYASVSPATTEFTDTNTAEQAHSYWVTAVSETMTESEFQGPVEQ